VDFQIIEPEERDAYPVAPFLSYARGRHTDRQERDPDVGDAVHLWDMVEARCRAAVVTQDDLDTVQLTYLMPGEASLYCEREVPHDETKGGPSWHWPCGGR
jgi:hypothetical protein